MAVSYQLSAISYQLGSDAALRDRAGSSLADS
jgi:hypothetical protein